MICDKCNGEKKILNPEWEEYADRLDASGSAGSYHIAGEWASQRFEKYIPCPKCGEK